MTASPGTKESDAIGQILARKFKIRSTSEPANLHQIQKQIDSLQEMFNQDSKTGIQRPTDGTDKMWSVGTVGKWDTTRMSSSKLDSTPNPKMFQTE